MLENKTQRNIFRWSIHLFIWVFLLLFPYLLSSGESFDLLRLVKFTWIPLFFSAILFYNNYLWLIDRFLLNKRIAMFVGINLITIVVFVWIHTEVRDFLNMIREVKFSPHATLPKPLPLQFFIYKDTVSLLIPVIVAIAAKATENWAKSEALKKEQEKNSLKNELAALRYQLQPHFFFNSLNTIYALIEKSPVQAQETVHGLSKLMRYVLYETNTPTTRIADDVEFMKEYIRLMKLRTADKTDVTSQFEISNPASEISPLLFLSLIENAFKHGTSATQTSRIHFEMKQKDGTVTFQSQNTSFPKSERDKSGSGIGLANLQKRLDLLYPGKHRFETKQVNDSFIATIEITTD